MQENFQPNVEGPVSSIPKSSNKKRNSIIAAAIVLVLAIGGVGAYLYMTPAQKDDATQAAVDTLTAQANALPPELKDAITKYLGISPREYLKRAETADKLEKHATSASKEYPDSFAGAYLDENGNAHMNFTSPDVSKNIDGVKKQIVEISDARLQADYKLVLEWMDKLPAAQRNAIKGVDIDYIKNRINISANDDAAGKSLKTPAATSATTAFSFWPVPKPTPTPPPTTTPTAPAPTVPADPSSGNASDGANNQLLSGDTVVIPVMLDGKPSTGACSLGFSASDSAGKVFAFTSGHCKQVGINYKQTGPLLAESRTAPGTVGGQIGNFTVYNYALNSSFDYALIEMNSTVGPAFKNAGIRTKLSPLKINGSTDPVQGAPICKSGRASGWTCGKITAKSTTFGGAEAIGGRYPNVAGFATDVCIRPGDSGGPMVSGFKAVGITSRVTYYNVKDCAAKGMTQRGGAGVPINTALQKLPGYKLNY